MKPYLFLKPTPSARPSGLMFNTVNTIRCFRRSALKAKLPKGTKKIIRERGFLDRWQVAKLLGICPSMLNGRVFAFSVLSGAVRLVDVADHTFIPGPRAVLP